MKRLTAEHAGNAEIKLLVLRELGRRKTRDQWHVNRGSNQGLGIRGSWHREMRISEWESKIVARRQNSGVRSTFKDYDKKEKIKITG